MIPKTMNEAIEILLKRMHITNKDYIKKLKEEDLITMHSTFGRQIRNDFKLWGENKDLIEDITGDRDTHPDDVSMIIMKEFWRVLSDS